MKHDARCDRSWEAEAIAEGRISDVDRASFERHVASCGVCARERAQAIKLDRLLTALPNADADSMRRQRLRRRILSSVGTEAGTRWRWALLPFAAVLACVALYLLRPSAPNHPVVVVAPPVRSAVTYEITDVRDGAWSEAPIDSGVEVRLTSGEVQFHVHKLGGCAGGSS